MKMTFLCARHREWLEANPTAAHNTWLRAYDRGSELAGEGRFREAVSHAGCALEAAGILLREGQPLDSRMIAGFSESAVLLASLLIRQQERRSASAVIAGSVASLEKLLSRNVERAVVLAGCKRLLQIGDDVVLARVPRNPQPGQATQPNLSVH